MHQVKFSRYATRQAWVVLHWSGDGCEPMGTEGWTHTCHWLTGCRTRRRGAAGRGRGHMWRPPVPLPRFASWAPLEPKQRPPFPPPDRQPLLTRSNAHRVLPDTYPTLICSLSPARWTALRLPPFHRFAQTFPVVLDVECFEMALEDARRIMPGIDVSSGDGGRGRGEQSIRIMDKWK